MIRLNGLNSFDMNDEGFDSLSIKVDDLIDLCTQMKLENQALKASASTWENERQQLLEKNEQAKSKLESILDRLKALDPT